MRVLRLSPTITFLQKYTLQNRSIESQVAILLAVIANYIDQ